MAIKHEQYAYLLAKEKQARGERSSVAFAWLRSKWEFFHQYILRGLIFDGSRGFLQARALSNYAFSKYAVLWSLGETNQPPDPRFAPELRKRRPENTTQ
jgi:(heptosyl)LPS beta-1,4-glucosyltransferase